jgi:hypothetical protein
MLLHQQRHPIVSVCTKYGPVACVVTVVVAGVKSLRPPRVELGWRLLVGYFSDGMSFLSVLCQRRVILQGVIVIMGPRASTLKTQITSAAAIGNVSVHLLVNRALTKIKLGSPLAKHVPVANIKIKMGNPLAKHVPVVNFKNKVGSPLFAKHVPVVNSKNKMGNPLAKHVPVANIKIKVGNSLAKHVTVALTAL